MSSGAHSGQSALPLSVSLSTAGSPAPSWFAPTAPLNGPAVPAAPTTHAPPPAATAAAAAATDQDPQNPTGAGPVVRQTEFVEHAEQAKLLAGDVLT